MLCLAVYCIQNKKCMKSHKSKENSYGLTSSITLTHFCPLPRMQQARKETTMNRLWIDKHRHEVDSHWTRKLGQYKNPDKAMTRWKNMEALRDERDEEMGNNTNQGTQLYSRVCSAHQDLGRPRLGAQGPRSSCSESESPGHRKPSTDSTQTTPPTGHALQTPIFLTHFIHTGWWRGWWKYEPLVWVSSTDSAGILSSSINTSNVLFNGLIFSWSGVRKASHCTRRDENPWPGWWIKQYGHHAFFKSTPFLRMLEECWRMLRFGWKL